MKEDTVHSPSCESVTYRKHNKMRAWSEVSRANRYRSAREGSDRMALSEAIDNAPSG